MRRLRSGGWRHEAPEVVSHERNGSRRALCQECVELRLGVP